MTLSAQTGMQPIVAGRVGIFQAATERLEPFTLGVTVTNDIDDNAFNDNRQRQYNISTVIAPHVAFAVSRPRYYWKVDYQQGLGISRPVEAYNSQSQILGTSVRFRRSKRLVIQADEHFLQSRNPFDRLPQSELASGTIADRPNNFLLNRTQTSSEQAGIGMTYALSLRTTVSAMGSFFNVSQIVGNGAATPLTTRSMAGHLVYSHRMTRRHWIGADYGVQRLDSWTPSSHAFVQSIFLADTLMLTTNSALSFAAGPQHTVDREASTLAVPSTGTHGYSNGRWGGNATYQWASEHSSVFLTYSHRLTNGEGRLGIVRSSDVSTQFQRQLTRDWFTDLLASYHRERAASFISSGLAYTSIAGGVKRRLSPTMSLHLIFWHIHEAQNGSLSIPFQSDHNRVSVSLIYDLKQATWK